MYNKISNLSDGEVKHILNKNEIIKKYEDNSKYKKQMTLILSLESTKKVDTENVEIKSELVHMHNDWRCLTNILIQ